uniref:Ig-like domain-containing protein n=1 Tax=Labrus bergylta TaxID=56723 RepID=A0A3Q3LCS6_9LABR
RTAVSPAVPSTLMVLPPSNEELQQGKATLVCLANKVDGISGGSWEESRGPAVMEQDARYSWSSTLRLSAGQWTKVGSVTCEATQGSQTLVSETLRRDQCSRTELYHLDSAAGFPLLLFHF